MGSNTPSFLSYDWESNTAINQISIIGRSYSRGYTIPLPEDRESDRVLEEMYLLALLFGFGCPGEWCPGGLEPF